MILVDTSVWVDHFRFGNAKLDDILDEGLAFTHPFVIGELACGNLRNRSRILTDLQALPIAICADHSEVLNMLDEHRLWGKGIGWIDSHLLASARLSDCRLWTLDGSLDRAAAAVGVR